MLIIGTKAAADFLGISRSTVARAVARAIENSDWDESEFPKPCAENPQGKGVVRIWEHEELQKFIIRPIGKPRGLSK